MTRAIEVVLNLPQVSTIWRQIDTPPPIWGGPGVGLVQTLGGVAMALALCCLIIAAILAATMIGVGHHARNSELSARGLKGIVGVVIAAAALGSVGGLITWGSALHIIGG